MRTILHSIKHEIFSKKTEFMLEDIRRENEEKRAVAAAGPTQKAVEVVSDPVTDQVIYYPLGYLLKEDEYGRVL